MDWMLLPCLPVASWVTVSRDIELSGESRGDALNTEQLQYIVQTLR